MDSQETRQLLSLLVFCSTVKINSFEVQEVVYPWANVQEKTLCMPLCAWQLTFALGELGRDTLPKVRTCWLIQVILKMKINRFLSRFLSKNSLLSSILVFFREGLICLDCSE